MNLSNSNEKRSCEADRLTETPKAILRLIASGTPEKGYSNAMLLVPRDRYAIDLLVKTMATMLNCAPPDYTEIYPDKFRSARHLSFIRTGSRNGSIFGACRVFHFQDSHKITVKYQEALVDIIKEALPTTYFIFCTNKPSKMVADLNACCQEYEIALVDEAKMLKVLKLMCRGATAKPPIAELQEIVKKSQGSIGMAFMMLEPLLTSSNRSHSSFKPGIGRMMGQKSRTITV